MTNKVYFFDSHPVQYKAPVYQELQRILPDSFEIIYASDFSVRGGNVDRGFGKEITWDTPLLSGYAFRVLGNEKGVPQASIWNITGKGIFSLLKKERPQAVVLTQSRYAFDHAAYISALLLDIPILIRQETQDELFSGQRGWVKKVLRSAAYRVMYAPVRHAFAFGVLNAEHLIRHGVDKRSISFAHFSVNNPFVNMTQADREAQRADMRRRLGFEDEDYVIGFFGKLIPIKNPQLIFHAIGVLPTELRARTRLLIVGAGALQAELDGLAQQMLKQWGVKTHFAGFINQSQLPPYYLASDTVVLPSVGEAWGLVINEALNAGCSAVVTNTVGCRKEFGHLDRVRTVPAGHAEALSAALVDVSRYQRSFTWAEEYMKDYSTEAAAAALKAQIVRYVRLGR